MEDALVAQVLTNFALQRFQVGQDVAMRNDHSTRLGRRARGEYDLHDVVTGERRRSDWRIGIRREVIAQ